MARRDGSALLVGGSQIGGTAGGQPVGCVLPLDAAYRQSEAAPGFCEAPPGLFYADFPDAVPDGRGGAMLAVNGERDPRNKVFGIARVDSAGATGTLDAALGSGGTLVFDSNPGPNEIVVTRLVPLRDAVEQPDGRIVVMGAYYERLRDTIGMLAFRLRPDGRIDRTFGPKRRR